MPSKITATPPKIIQNNISLPIHPSSALRRTRCPQSVVCSISISTKSGWAPISKRGGIEHGERNHRDRAIPPTPAISKVVLYLFCAYTQIYKETLVVRMQPRGGASQKLSRRICICPKNQHSGKHETIHRSSAAFGA